MINLNKVFKRKKYIIKIVKINFVSGGKIGKVNSLVIFFIKFIRTENRKQTNKKYWMTKKGKLSTNYGLLSRVLKFNWMYENWVFRWGGENKNHRLTVLKFWVFRGGRGIRNQGLTVCIGNKRGIQFFFLNVAISMNEGYPNIYT